MAVPDYITKCKTKEQANAAVTRYLGSGLKTRMTPNDNPKLFGNYRYIVEGWKK